MDLKELIAAKSVECEDDTSRAALQDFCALPCLLSKAWWQVLESRKSRVSKLEDLTDLAGKLSLRNPTEATYGALVCLAFFAEYGEAWTESDQLSLLKQQKAKIKKWLAKFGPCVTRLETLPESLEDLPPAMQTTIYPDGCTSGQPSIMSLERLRRMIANFRLRDRKDGMASSSLPVSGQESHAEGVAQLVGACAGLVRQATSHAASVTTPPEPPRLRLYTKSPDPKGHSSFLAIKDKEDVDRDETVDNAAAQALEVANKAQTPAQAIAALQTGLTTEAARDRPPSQRMPRPAAAKSALKRPASSLQ